MKQNTPHEKAVRTVYNLLRRKKMYAQRTPYRHPFDLLVDGIRLDIKTAVPAKKSPFSKAQIWNFVIHSHGKAKENPADFYILYISPIIALGMGAGIYLVVPAGDVAGKKNIWISGRSLLTKWGKYADDWQAIQQKRRKS